MQHGEGARHRAHRPAIAGLCGLLLAGSVAGIGGLAGVGRSGAPGADAELAALEALADQSQVQLADAVAIEAGDAAPGGVVVLGESEVPADVAEVPVVLVLGGRAALELGVGMLPTGDGDPRVVVGAEAGCPVLPGRVLGVRVPDGCSTWAGSWTALVDRFAPDLVVVRLDVADHATRLLPGDDTWRSPGDPVLDERLAAELTAMAAALTEGGARLAWISGASDGPLHDVVVGALDGVAGPQGDEVEVVAPDDVPAWSAQHPTLARP